MIAALPMYDRAQTASANDRLWQALRQNLGYGPETLTRNDDPWPIWRAPDLVLAQTCGLPFRTKLHAHVTLIGTPDYGLPDCPPGMYNSVFVVRKDDPRTDLKSFAKTRFAYNEALSQSGWAAAQTHAAKHDFRFENIVKSGAHRDSARMVSKGVADIASLDALSWDMMRQWDKFAENLRVIARTEPSPALPFIAAKNASQPTVFRALSAAISTLNPADRKTLRLKSLIHIPASEYLVIATPPGP